MVTAIVKRSMHALKTNGGGNLLSSAASFNYRENVFVLPHDDERGRQAVVAAAQHTPIHSRR